MTSARIDVIAGALQRDEAERRLVTLAESPDWMVATQRELYYPYHWVSLRFSATTLFGKSAARIYCMVDARTGIAATTDRFELESVEPGARRVVEPCVGEAEALTAARRYGGYVMRSRRRALVTPRIDVLAHALVFKPMSVVRLSCPGRPGFRVLVDGMSGGFHVLDEPTEVRSKRPLSR